MEDFKNGAIGRIVKERQEYVIDKLNTKEKIANISHAVFLNRVYLEWVRKNPDHPDEKDPELHEMPSMAVIRALIGDLRDLHGKINQLDVDLAKYGIVLENP